jgi:hypothetical protein
MKKAKIMLMAIAVLTIVGGSLALKAAKFGVLHPFFKCTSIGTVVGGETVYACIKGILTSFTTLGQATMVIPYSAVKATTYTTDPCPAVTTTTLCAANVVATP